MEIPMSFEVVASAQNGPWKFITVLITGDDFIPVGSKLGSGAHVFSVTGHGSAKGAPRGFLPLVVEGDGPLPTPGEHVSLQERLV